MGKPKRVLVIDDEEIVRVCCTRVLTPRGFKVDTAGDGAEGLKLVNQQEYDVVFTDLKMPDMDGQEVVKNIKRLSPGTRIVVVTGYNTEEMREQAASTGADYYLEKPFTPEALMGALGL